MQQALARVRVLVLTATTAVFSIAAIAAAISNDTHKALVLAILEALPAADRMAVSEATEPPSVVPVRTAVQAPVQATAPTTEQAVALSSAAPDETPHFSRSEELPSAGVLTSRELADPHNPDEPLLIFTPRQAPLAADKVIRTAFAKTNPGYVRRAVALARLPQAKPASTWLAPDQPERSSPLMAYARVPSSIEAPFSAVLSQRSAVVEEPDDGLYRPRPRPDAGVLDAWLDGRAPAQFAPGQHPWLQNPLPATVYAQKQQKCLAEGIYFESRGEPESGQAAVAQVILNRVRNPAYPSTICGVVYQNENKRHHCQFSFACDGRAEIIRSQRAWKVAQRIGRDVTDGKLWIDEVGDSTHYHAKYVSPRWGRRMIKVDKIGAHIFYRTRFGGWS